MSKARLVTFSTTVEDIGYPDLELYQLRLRRSAHKIGIGSVDLWTRTRLKRTQFFERNRELLQEKRGAGYWIWKPYIIQEALNEVEVGDFVIYSDCTTVFHSSLNVLLELCAENKGYFLITQDSQGRNGRYTKRDAFVLMDCDTPHYRNSTMTEAFFQIYQKNDHTIKFVNKYLEFCENPAIVTDSANIMERENFNEFVTHKHDMSVLSLLRLMNDIPGFRNPSQWGNHQKMEAYRREGEFLAKGYQDVLMNSPYDSIMGWREDTENLKRPWHHYIQAAKVMGAFRRILGQ